MKHITLISIGAFLDYVDDVLDWVPLALCLLRLRHCLKQGFRFGVWNWEVLWYVEVVGFDLGGLFLFSHCSLRQEDDGFIGIWVQSQYKDRIS